MDVKTGFRLVGAMAANVMEYLMQGGELCTVSGVRLGTGYGLILGGLCNVLYNSGGVIAGVEMLGTGLAYGAMAGWLGNLFIGLPMFFVAAFFAPPREGRAVRPGYLLWELRQVFGRYQTIGSVTFALAGCFIGVALKILLGSGSDQTLVELLLLAGAALGATVGGVAGTVHAINRSNAFQRAEMIRAAAEGDAAGTR